MARNSYLSLAMSTPESHSALQALHSRQRSSAWCSLGPVKSASGNNPDRAARSRFARPRVECSSSLVAMKEGHMEPSSLRQAPIPLHISTAPAKLVSREKSNLVGRDLAW